MSCIFLFSIPRSSPTFRRPKKVVPLHLQKLKTLYDTIKDYHDTKGRQLSLIFMKLPNKNEYPDYYEVIKQPIHMEKIAATLKNNGYENLDELVSDFILMFDNACKYNEPDSQIYKVCIDVRHSLSFKHIVQKNRYCFMCAEKSTRISQTFNITIKPDLQCAISFSFFFLFFLALINKRQKKKKRQKIHCRLGFKNKYFKFPLLHYYITLLYNSI